MARGRRIEVEILGDSRSLERAFSRSSRSGKRFNRDISQAGRGVVAVSGLFSGLGRQVAFASSAFLGGAGFTKVLRDSIAEAADATKTQRQLAAQFRANGQDLRVYQQQIDSTSTRLSKLAGIQDEELTQAFTNAFRGTKDVTAALKVEAVAADVARGRGVALSAAGIALTKAYLGQTTALKRLGIQIPANVKGMEALELVGRRFAGQAQAGTTAQQRLSVAISETEETIGKALLPTVEKITRSITEWLNSGENQQRIQEGVNEALRDGAKIAKGLLTAFNVLRAVLKPIVDGLGGIENAATVAGLALVSLKARSYALALGLTRSSAAAGTLRTKLLGLRALGTIGIAVVVGIELKKVGQDFSDFLGGTKFGKAIGAGNTSTKDFAEQLKKAVAAGINPAELQKLLKSGILNPAQRAAVKKVIDEALANLATGLATDDRQPGRSPGGAGAFGAAPGAGKGGGTGRLGLLARFAKAELVLAKAGLTTTAADDRAALKVEVDLIRQMIASHKKAFKDKTALTNQLAGVLDQIQAIDDAASRKRIDAQEKAAAKAKKARDKERAARKKAHDAMVRAAKEAADAAKAAARDFRDLIQTERDRIGELFTGSFLNPSDAQRKAALGAPTPGSNVKALVADLKSQIQAFKAFQRDLAKLASRGAPPQLLAELRQGGLGIAPQVHALATSGAADFAKFKGFFVQRERLAVQTAERERPTVNIYITIDRNGKITEQRVKTTPHGQKRGRNPGVVITNAGHGLLGH